MNKKSIISLFTGAALMFSMPSCTDLDETVYDKIPAENFGKTDGEINSIIGPAYNTFKRYFSDACIALSECSGDMAVVPTRKGGDWYDGGQYRELHMHAWTANTSAVKNAWSRSTEAISACNLIYETISTSALEESAKARALAEIRGVRAFWIYYLMDNWGNVPLSIDYNDTELPTCKTRKEVYDWLVKEVNEIKDLLREDVSDASYGKFTKGAAYTLLAKLYLNAEAWGVDSPRYKEAADACDVVMGLPYILEANWKTNFQVNNQQSREAILACCFSANDTEWQNQLHYRTLHYKDNIPLGATFSA